MGILKGKSDLRSLKIPSKNICISSGTTVNALGSCVSKHLSGVFNIILDESRHALSLDEDSLTVVRSVFYLFIFQTLAFVLFCMVH